MHGPLILLLVLSGPFDRKGPHGHPGRPSDTASISGDSESLALGMEWATKVAPAHGRITSFVFLVQVTGTQIGSQVARGMVEVHDSGKDLCYIDVPCTQGAGTYVTAATNGACDLATYDEGDVIHIEWASSGCLTRPSGTGTANMVMP
jgi:hypothetical protein